MGLSSREINKLYQAITVDDFSGKIDLNILIKKFQRLEYVNNISFFIGKIKARWSGRTRRGFILSKSF